MNRVARIVVCLPGAMLLANAFGWIINPTLAAERLGMPILEGLALSTQIGNSGALFLSSAIMIFIGAWTQKTTWLIAAAIAMGATMLMRMIAYAAHEAELASQFITVELLIVAVLVAVAWYLNREQGAQDDAA